MTFLLVRVDYSTFVITELNKCFDFLKLRYIAVDSIVMILRIFAKWKYSKVELSTTQIL